MKSLLSLRFYSFFAFVNCLVMYYMVLEEDFAAACLYIATAVVRVHWQYTRCKSPQNGLLWISSIPAALCLSPFNQWSRSGTSNGISAISQLEVPYVCPQQFLVCFISSFIFCITKTSWWGPSRYMVVTFLTRNHCKNCIRFWACWKLLPFHSDL